MITLIINIILYNLTYNKKLDNGITIASIVSIALLTTATIITKCAILAQKIVMLPVINIVSIYNINKRIRAIDQSKQQQWIATF